MAEDVMVEEQVSFVEVSLDQLRLSDLNPRKEFDENKLKELAKSIKEKGIIQALVVRNVLAGLQVDGKNVHDAVYEIVCGARRFKAAQLAGLEKVPAIVRDLDNKAMLEVMSIENLQRADVHPLEEAEAYEKLINKHGYDVKNLAAKMGKSDTYIYQRLKLCELIPENRKLFYAGKFIPSVALLVARIPEHLQLKAGEDIVKGAYGCGKPMNHEEAQDYIENELMLRMSEAPFSIKSDGIAGKPACSVCPKMTGNDTVLFPELNKDNRCTDPKCWVAKKAAYEKQIIDEAKSDGKNVLTASEAKKIFNNYGCIKDRSKYAIMDEEVRMSISNPDLQGTPRQLIKKAKAKIETKFVLNKNKLVEIVETDVLAAALKEAGLIKKIPEKRSDEVDGHERKRQRAIDEAVDQEVGFVLFEKMQKDKKRNYTKMFCLTLLDTTGYFESGYKFYAEKLGLVVKEEDTVFEAVKDHLQTLKGSDDLLFVTAFIVMFDEVVCRPNLDRSKEIMKMYGIDRKKIEKEVKAKIAAEEKAAAKQKPDAKGAVK